MYWTCAKQRTGPVQQRADVCVWSHTTTHTHTHTHTFTHTYIHTRTHARTYTHTHTYTHTRTYMYTKANVSVHYFNSWSLFTYLQHHASVCSSIPCNSFDNAELLYLMMYLIDVPYWCVLLMYLIDVPHWCVLLMYLIDVPYLCALLMWLFLTRSISCVQLDCCFLVYICFWHWYVAACTTAYVVWILLLGEHLFLTLTRCCLHCCVCSLTVAF